MFKTKKTAVSTDLRNLYFRLIMISEDVARGGVERDANILLAAMERYVIGTEREMRHCFVESTEHHDGRLLCAELKEVSVTPSREVGQMSLQTDTGLRNDDDVISMFEMIDMNS